jgi:hypothetical protein
MSARGWCCDDYERRFKGIVPQAPHGRTDTTVRGISNKTM